MRRNLFALAALVGIVAGLALVMGSVSNAQAAELDGHVMMGEYDHATSYDNGRYVLFWTVDSGTAHVAIRAQTTGWVAMGLSPTDAMNNSDILLGYVTELGEVMLFDAYATGPNGPHPLDTDLGGTNDVTMYNGSEGDGWTTIEFQRLVNTGDMYDKPFISYITINWAVGPDDSFATQHTRRGSATFPGIGELKLVSAPEMAYVGEQVDVTFNLSLWGAYTYDMVSHAAVHWDMMSHPEPWAVTNYPHASNIVSGDPMGDYSVQFTAPEQAGTVYFILHSIISGTHVYGTWEYMVEVKEMPHVAFGSTQGVVIAGRNVTVDWYVNNAEASEVTHTAVHWDTVSHAGDMMFSDYPNASLGAMGTEAGHYMTEFTVPEDEGAVYFIVHAIVNGRHFYNMSERMISVVAVPTVSLVSAPEAVFVDRMVTFTWAVDADSAYVTHTAVHWDVESHSGMMDFTMYPNALPGTMTENDGEYMAEMDAPSSTGMVYFVVHAIALGEHFYAPMEYTISVLEEPTLTLDAAPDTVIVGKEATFEWTIGGVMSEDVSHTAVHWDTTSHSGGIFSDYANALPGTMGATEGEYMATMTAPSSPGTVYFVVHAIILGEHFYADGEQMLVVKAMPTVTLDEAPEKVLAGRNVTFKWTIHDASAGDITHTAIHWDTTSHSGGVFSDYANALPGTAGTGAGEYMATMTAPSSPATVYFVAHAIVMGEHIYATMEYMVMVKAEPTVTMVVGPAKAYVNSTVTFRWNVTGADAADVTHTAVHWDTTSHSGGVFSDYANALPGQAGGAMSGYMATMTAPASPTTIYYIFHATVLGEHFYYMSEMTLDVRAMPSISGVEFKDKVTAGKEVKVAFKLTGAPVGEVTHVAVHWDTTSHAGSMDFNAYPNAVTATPSADGTYEITFKAPKDKGTVYFVVHAIVDGEHYYAEGEQSLTVEEEDSPGFGAVAALAAVVVSVGLGMAFMRRRVDE